MQPLPLHHRLLAVIDDPDDLPAALDVLLGAGMHADDLETLVGAEGMARLDRTGRRAGPLRRLARWLSYLTADQSVDLATYEAALADGRGILVARLPDPKARRRAVAALRSVRPHFVNYFGPIATQDIIPWRGRQLDLPYYFHR